ncbi:hypothetical protein HAX54_030984 [Datura stramonium]|uniref:Uncharacterized protein n=1 Tax=Datura stramonium TaxID=4076 RepID=A0ABS8V8H4_DATST|nr:hypothetical protein [Datura stramonium]
MSENFIAYHHDLLTTKRQREMQSFPAELKTRYGDAIICTNDLKTRSFKLKDEEEALKHEKQKGQRHHIIRAKDFTPSRQRLYMIHNAFTPSKPKTLYYSR